MVAGYSPNNPNQPHTSDAQLGGRMNVLLTDHGQDWASHIPALLEPQGVRSYRAQSFDQAVELIQSTPIHVALVDMALGGVAQTASGHERLPAGLKLLKVIHRIEGRPPAVVVVRGRSFQQRLDNFVLNEALKLDAFSVLDDPVNHEQLLNVLQRALERYFDGQWPRS